MEPRAAVPADKPDFCENCRGLIWVEIDRDPTAVSADTIELGWLANVLGRHLETFPDARLLTAEHPGRCGIGAPPYRDEVMESTFAPAAAHLDALAAEGAKVARWSG